ncbi:MAG: hypothetical protein AAF721_35240 [Myxococcota bacterium]
MTVDEHLGRDRRLYHLHAATFLVGVGGLVLTVVLAGAFEDWVGAALFAGFGLVLVVSGIAAIKVGRTLLSKRVDEDLPGLDPYDDDGDALMSPGLWSLDLWPSSSNATAPWAVLMVGLVFAALGSYWCYRAFDAI